MAVVLAIGVPFLLPHMHERYFFLADVLTLCWAFADRKKIPVCVLVNISSLASYLVYLRLQYNCVISIWGVRFVMPLEAAAMFAALILSAMKFVREINVCKGNKLCGGEAYETGILECERPAGVPEKGVRGIDAGTGGRCDLPSGDEDAAGPGRDRPSGLS
jgi:hypothetical protein